MSLQTLSIRKGDYVRIRVDAAPRAAAPHALHAVARAVGTQRPQRAQLLAWPCVLVWADWNKPTNRMTR